ncbi:hypothetical protein SUSAZ_04285 [Sulfolobus acidocaldarius SUSAZ]|nr:hypothetical protein SUSAZ_04285 [Sulfolobus acidocaldarius SUSAZ]
MNNIISDYLNAQPKEKLKIVEIDIPCGTECLKNSKYSNLLNIESFKEQIEILDSLKSLIEEKIDTLEREIHDKVNGFNVNIEELTYSIYESMQNGKDYIIGQDSLKFEDKVLARGKFQEIISLSQVIDSIKKDRNIISLCDEIRYLSESLWEHFNKNIRRVLNESNNRS